MNTNQKNNAIVVANLLTIGMAILNDISGNEVSNKISSSTAAATAALSTRIEANLNKQEA